MHKAGTRLVSALAVRGSSSECGRAVGAAGRRRGFHAARRALAVKPFLLADIGEGIKEVQIIQWFVQPGARVEQFDKICEVQSDKASVDITSRFDGVIKKLHYEPDAMAQVGKPLLDIDITGDIASADKKLLDEPATDEAAPETATSAPPLPPSHTAITSGPPSSSPARSSRSAASLATPAVRGLLKERALNIDDIHGTGRDGRVLKEDVHNHVSAPMSSSAPSSPPFTTTPSETPQPLTPMQLAMFRSMTRSLAIPHFLCADDVDLTTLTALRRQLNAQRPDTTPKLSALAFLIKAVSLALVDFPLLNARLDTSDPARPQLIHRREHNIGVAIDTAQGLMVPNIKNVAALSIPEIAAAISALSARARAGKLTSAELKGGTITVSNIGSIGGTYATPLLVEGEVAIVAMGRSKIVPAFGADGAIERREMAALSWSADHRVVDGAMVARMGRRVRELVEGPGAMAVLMR